jgi:hypothetical protein
MELNTGYVDIDDETCVDGITAIMMFVDYIENQIDIKSDDTVGK